MKRLQPSRLPKAILQTTLETLNFKPLLEKDGISIANLRRLEQMNYPFSDRILQIAPTLSAYSGLAISLFRGRITRGETTSKKGEAALLLFPTYLSEHCDNPSYLNIDLLIDNAQFRDGETTKPPPNSPAGVKHVLCITSLVKLCGRRNPFTKKNVSSFRHICRRCLKLFQTEEDYRYHCGVCRTFAKK